jgi:Transposase DDE domain
VGDRRTSPAAHHPGRRTAAGIEPSAIAAALPRSSTWRARPSRGGCCPPRNWGAARRRPPGVALPSGPERACSSNSTSTSSTGSASRAGSTGRALAQTQPAYGPSVGDHVGANPVDRGKPGSKIQLVCDGHGLPLAAAVTAANVADVTMLQAMVGDIPPVRTPSGRPAATPTSRPVTAGPPAASGGRGRRQDPARQRPPRPQAGPPAGGDGPHQPRGPGPDRGGRRDQRDQRDHPIPAAAGPLGPRRHRGHCRCAPHPRQHADWLVTGKHAAYLLVVKANQPALHQQLKILPWRDIPVADHTRDRGHGRVEVRRLQVTTIAGLDFPTPPRPCGSPAGSGRLAAAAGAR